MVGYGHMTDIRFHVVSLAAVFLALAAGIVLGSGPLRTALVGELSDEVTSLEAQVAETEAQVALERDNAALGEQFVDEAATAIIGDALGGVNVALVVVAGAEPDAVEAQRQRIVDAGGTVTGVVTVDESWTDPDQSAFRSALAGQIADNVEDALGLAPDRLLAHALAQALVDRAQGGDDVDATVASAESDASHAAVLLDLLREAELVSGTVSGASDAIVVVAGNGDDDGDARALQSTTLAHMAGVFADYDAAVVVAAGDDGDGSLARSIRDSADTSPYVSTVSSGTTYYGRLSVVLAVAEQVHGGQGHYGPQDDLALVPDVARVP